MLLLTALLALLASGLQFGGWSARLGIAVCGCIVFSRSIDLIVSSDVRRAGAFGFLLASVSYLILTLFVSDYEYEAANGLLPQTSLIQRSIQRDLADFDWSEFEQSQFDYVIEAEAYLAQMTMPRLVLVHMASGLMLGLFGGWYAHRVYSQSRMETK